MSDSTFFNDVYEVVRLIPKGKVTTYGAIARYLGSGKSARVVGYAMNTSFTIIPKIPAQRVVNRIGLLTGKHHFANPTMMQELLEKEGLEIVSDQIQNFDKHYWDPTIELAL